MAIYAKESKKGDFIVTPQGNHQAVCYDVWDLGYQSGEWQGTPILQHKIIIGWEIEETIPTGQFAGKRFCINKWYTLSLDSKSNLRKDVESWRGKMFTDAELNGFDVESLVGMNCLLNVGNSEKNGKIVASVLSVSPLPKSMPRMAVENKRSIPDWIKKIQAKQVEKPNDGIEDAEMVGDAQED